MQSNKRTFFSRVLILLIASLILIGSSAVFAAEPHKAVEAPALQTQTTCDPGQEIMNWSAIPWPRVGGPGTGLITQPISYTYGPGKTVTFTWENPYQEPYVYGDDAPIVEMNEDLRVPNSDTLGSLTMFTVTFDPPVYLNEFTVGSLSVLNDFRYEYAFLSAFDDANIIQPAESFSTSTYVTEGTPPNLTLQTIAVPGQAVVSPSGNVYRLRGTSDQPQGYDRVTLNFGNTAAIERVELVIFGSENDTADTALQAINLEPISTTIEAFCFTDPSTLDVTLKNVNSAVNQNDQIWLVISMILLTAASAYVWRLRKNAL